MTSQAKLLLSGLAIALLSVAGANIALAQTGKTTPRTKTAARVPEAGRAVLDGNGAADSEKPERPQRGVVLQVPTLSPALEKVLKDWEEKSAKIVKLQGEFDKFQYNEVFFTEKRSVGKFYYEAPDRGFYNVEGIKAKAAAKKDWKVEPGADERWLCTGKEVYAFQINEKSYEKHVIPAEEQGKNIMDGPLPFLFGMKAEESKKRYDLKLIKQEKGEIWIEATPRRPVDIANWKKATVIIDAKTFLPKAVRLQEPGEGCYTVHTFRNLEQPGNGGILRRLFPFDPLKLNIPKDFRLVIKSESAEAEAAGIAQIGPEPQRAAPPKVGVQAKIQPAAAVGIVNYGTLKKELQGARTKADLERGRLHVRDVYTSDSQLKNAADRILSKEELDDLAAIYNKRAGELSK